MIKYILTGIYLIFTTAGIFLMKLGGNSLALTLKNGITFKIGYLTLCGFVCYLFSFLLWQKLLTTFDLSYIVPITTGISQIIIVCIGYFFFKEQLSGTNILGILLVIVGVVLLSMKK